MRKGQARSWPALSFWSGARTNYLLLVGCSLGRSLVEFGDFMFGTAAPEDASGTYGVAPDNLSAPEGTAPEGPR
jgi:hypothetical protein